MMPACSTRDAVRVQVHRGEVVQRCQSHGIPKLLHSRVAGVIFGVAHGQVQHVAAEVLQRFGQRIGHHGPDGAQERELAGSGVEARNPGQRCRAFLMQTDFLGIGHLPVEAGDEQHVIAMQGDALHPKAHTGSGSHIRCLVAQHLSVHVRFSARQLDDEMGGGLMLAGA